MIALWIVLAVVVVLALSATIVIVRRRAAGGTKAPASPRPAPATAPPRPEAPPPRAAPPEPTVTAEHAPSAQPTAAPTQPVAQPTAAPTQPVAQPTAAPTQPSAQPTALRDRLGRTRGLFAPLRALGGRADRAAALAAAEDALLRADVGVDTTNALVAGLRQSQAGRDDADGVLGALGRQLVAILAENPDRSLRFDKEPGVVNVWLFVGVNGVGKTTTLGKLALAQRIGGHSVLLAAGDTFRAAAADQLALWAERAGTEIVRGAEGGDPSSVVFDAVQRARARGNDLVLADTAGRLHTKVNLVDELRKIRRVADREPGRVTEVLLVLDATTGQNALAQAREFTEAVGVTGVVLTKLDGTAKGGVVIAIERQLGLPVKLVGVGEGPEDMIAFDPESFVDALVGL